MMLIGVMFILLVIVRVLLMVAFLTLFESVVLAHVHSSSGPNMVGFQGLAQAMVDAVKLMTKEYMQRLQSSSIMFHLSRVFTFVVSTLNWAVMPFNEGVVISDLDLGMIYILILAMSSVYGVLLSGWASNSKYSLLGSLSSTAQMLGYDITVSLVLFSVILVMGSLNFTVIVLFQGYMYLALVYRLMFVGATMNGLAEVNSVPFDLPEAEPELVSGYNTEYGGIGFTLFFLAEYCSILVMSVVLVLIFLGGWI